MKVRPATTMEPNAEQRRILVQVVLAEAEEFHRLKWNFPYYTEVDFEPTPNIFGRHGCIWIWRGADWDGTSAITLCNLFADLRRNVQYVRNVEILCASGQT